VEAFAAFFRNIERKHQQNYYELAQDILNILVPLKQAGDSAELTKALMALIELAEAAPRMFKGYFNSLVTFSITVIQDKELEDLTRQNALELMATFADQAPQMCKKDPNYTSEMVTQCLSLMTDVGIDDDDASEWNMAEDVSALSLPIQSNCNAYVGHRLKQTKTMPITLLVSNAWIVLPTSLVARRFFPLPSTGFLV
jgi:hypothetical protein